MSVAGALIWLGVAAGVVVIVVAVPWWVSALLHERRTYELMRSVWAPPDHPARQPMEEK